MKIGLICNDNELISRIHGMDIFKTVKVYNSLKHIEDDLEVLIISDRIVDINELIKHNELIKIKHTFYMVSEDNYSFNTNAILESRGINMLPPKLTVKQLIGQICDKVLGYIENENNIVTFFGSDSKVGTTMITQSVVEKITSRLDVKVLILFLNGNKGANYFNRKIRYNLDSIKVKLINQIVSKEEIMDVCMRINNCLYILPGVESLLYRRHYHPEHIEYLLELLKPEFDMIFIDAGCNFDLGMSIASINSTMYKYLVTTQQTSAYESYARIRKQIFAKLDIKDYMLILNKYVDNDRIYSDEQIIDMYKVPLISKVPLLTYGWQCEFEKHSLLYYYDKEYNKAIDSIISIISKQINFDYELRHPKNNLFARLRERFVN